MNWINVDSVFGPLPDDVLVFFSNDSINGKRYTPSEYHQQNNAPLLVVKNGQFLAYNIHGTALRGKDTFTYRHSFAGAIGISKRR